MVGQEKVTLASIVRDIKFGDNSTYGSVQNLPGRSNTTLLIAVRGIDVPKDAQDKVAKTISQNILLGQEGLLDTINSNSVAKAVMLNDPEELSVFYLDRYRQRLSENNSHYGNGCGLGLRDIGRLVLKLKPEIKWAARELFHDAADIHLINSKKYSLDQQQKALVQDVVMLVDKLLLRYARLQSIGGHIEQAEYNDELVAILDKVDLLDEKDTKAVNSNDLLQAMVNNVYAAACSLKRNPIKSVDPFAQNDFFREDMERIAALRASLFGFELGYVSSKSEHLEKGTTEYIHQHNSFKSLYCDNKSGTVGPYPNDMLFLFASGFLNKFDKMQEAVFKVLNENLTENEKNTQRLFLNSYIQEFKKRYDKHSQDPEFVFPLKDITLKYTKTQFKNSPIVKIARNAVDMINLYLSSYEKPDELFSNECLEQAQDHLLSKIVLALEFLRSEEEYWNEKEHSDYVAMLRPEYGIFENKFRILEERLQKVKNVGDVSKELDPIFTSIRQISPGSYEFENYQQLYESAKDRPEVAYVFLAFCVERKFQLWADASKASASLDQTKTSYVKLMKQAEALLKGINSCFQGQAKDYLDSFMVKGLADNIGLATSSNPELKSFIERYHSSKHSRPAPPQNGAPQA